MVNLTELPIGQPARISAIVGTPDFIERMQELGLVCGTVVTVLRRSPFGGTLQLRYGSTTLALRLSGEQSIRVESLEHSHRQYAKRYVAIAS